MRLGMPSLWKVYLVLAITFAQTPTIFNLVTDIDLRLFAAYFCFIQVKVVFFFI